MRLRSRNRELQQAPQYRRRRGGWRQPDRVIEQRTADRGTASFERNPLGPDELVKLDGPTLRQRRRVGVDTARVRSGPAQGGPRRPTPGQGGALMDVDRRCAWPSCQAGGVILDGAPYLFDPIDGFYHRGCFKASIWRAS